MLKIQAAFDNQAARTRLALDLLKKDPEAFGNNLLFALSRGNSDGQDTFKRFIDLKLLPSYDRIARYFGIAVSAASSTPEGFSAKLYSPTPAEAAK